jgi:hypothetical protein
MRLSNWESHLSEYIQSKKNQPFEYGVNDCCLFAAGAVEAVIGENPIPEFIGAYDSLKTSIKALKSIGAGTLEKTMDEKFTEIQIGYAQTGDLAFHDGSIGVIIDADAMFVSDDGLVRVSRDKWTKTWRVGRG